MNRRSQILNLCTATENLFAELPERTTTSREAFFAPSNLWSLEVKSTCNQIFDHYKAVLVLIDQGLPRPAAALARTIADAYCRFLHLVENKDQLESWTKWQLTQDFWSLRDSIQFDTYFPPHIQQKQVELMDRYTELLGGTPRRWGFPWKSTKKMLRSTTQNLPEGTGDWLYRTGFQFFSRYVHISRAVDPPPEFTVGSSEQNVLMSITAAMVLCLDEKMFSLEASDLANGILVICERLQESATTDNISQQVQPPSNT